MYNKKCSLSMWLRYLEDFNKKKVFNLIQLTKIAKNMGLLDIKSFIFTVAGTNGKGTTCAILEKLLLNSGYTVGLYSSPHLMNYLERIKINGNILQEEEHITAFKEIELAKGSFLLTYFEFITLTALFLFKQYSLDVIILEVGLGGRLDATNIIDSHISLITNIGIDHTFFLGSCRSVIAREKSGIFRKNRIAVIGEKNIPSSIDEVARKKKTILKKINVDWFYKKNYNNWDFIHSNIELYNLPITNTPLSNISTALSALYYSKLIIDEKIVKNSINKIQLLGRFQLISNFPRIILDVAHNPHASLQLFKQICRMNIQGNIYAIVGFMRDKDIAGILNPLKKIIRYWYTAPLKSNKTASINQLKNQFPQKNTYILNNINEACKIVFKIVKKEDLILIFGSFLTVSEFINIQNKENKKNILNKIIVDNLCL